jgi:hypothetical protein
VSTASSPKFRELIAINNPSSLPKSPFSDVYLVLMLFNFFYMCCHPISIFIDLSGFYLAKLKNIFPRERLVI